jgi:Ca-activated chloride channel family protein
MRREPHTSQRPERASRARRSLIPFLLSLALLTLFAPAGAARQDEDEVVKVEANLVVLNATVTGADGRFVRKLKRTDFRVYEDGSEQRITLFGLEETPFAAAVLLDTSGSMEGRLSLARAAAIRFLDGLRVEDVAAIYKFDSEVEQLQDFAPGRDLPPTAYSLGPRGMTVLHDAVLRAARDLSSRPEQRRAIVVLSDGADTRSAASADKALDAALAAGAVIYTVNMADPRIQGMAAMTAGAALKNFAEKSGGRYISKPGGQALSEAFAEIVEELSSQYTIGYRPSNRARDGRWRSIELKVSKPDAAVRTRRGYRAPKR